MLISGWKLWGAIGPIRASRVMKAQFKPGPVNVTGHSSGLAPTGERKGYALRQKGKDQHRGGKLPPHAP